MKKGLIIIAFLQVCLMGLAQDRQFSQFSASPLNLNPALTGNNACDWRIGLNLRNEWLSVNNSFLLGSVYGDVAIGKTKNRKTNFGGIGVIANFDNAGQLNYQTTDALISAAYHLVLGKRGNNVLSFGLQGGIRYYSFSLGKVILDDNIDFVTGGVTQGNNIITNSNAILPDANFGILFNHKKNDKLGFYVGAAGFHLPQSKYTYTNGNSTETNYMKISSQFGMNIGIGRQVTIMPQVVWMWQNVATQWRAGTYVKYNITDLRRTNKTNQAVYLGGWFWKAYQGDKLSFAMRYDYGNLNIGVSYDFDISKLSSVSAMGGSPELSISFTGCLKRNPNKFGCPVIL